MWEQGSLVQVERWRVIWLCLLAMTAMAVLLRCDVWFNIGVEWRSLRWIWAFGPVFIRRGIYTVVVVE